MYSLVASSYLKYVILTSTSIVNTTVNPCHGNQTLFVDALDLLNIFFVRHWVSDVNESGVLAKFEMLVLSGRGRTGVINPRYNRPTSSLNTRILFKNKTTPNTLWTLHKETQTKCHIHFGASKSRMFRFCDENLFTFTSLRERVLT